MSKIAVLGPEEFVIGFQLTGIKDTIITGKSPLDDIKAITQNKEIGIVIIDENTVNALDYHDRMDIENSINPVFVQLSTKATQDSLRKLIKKSIGVDLWQMERG